MLELNFKVHWNKYTPFKLKRITRFFPVLLFVSVEPTWVCLSFDFRHVDDHSCQCIISYDISVTPFFPCMPFAKTGPDTMHFCYLPLVVNSTLLRHDIGLMKKWNAFVLVRRDAKFFKEKECFNEKSEKTGDCLLMPSSPTVLTYCGLCQAPPTFI